ncbi:hypothetical protein Zmor_002751 [Zophobas morio]|uniref:Uncharacterized protein n=1 Tax=Zophobas morio TaxID=2755281 RepID=A0AA38HK76_9CUCU|nr:hypothetical protein Zmor_002751 [Zophobas morio]
MVAVCTTHLSSVVGNFDLDGAEFALLRGATPFDTEVNMSRRTDRGYVEGADSVGWFRGGGDEVVGGGRWRFFSLLGRVWGRCGRFANGFLSLALKVPKLVQI